MRRALSLSVLVLVFLGIALPASACGPKVRITFAEDSPDWFRIEFLEGPKLSLERLAIRLATSRAGAFFEGDGPEMSRHAARNNAKSNGIRFKALRYETGIDHDAILDFEGFVAGGQYVFHSDLDDLNRAGNRDGDHIYDGELAGATATATLRAANGKQLEINGTFDDKGKVLLGERACV